MRYPLSLGSVRRGGGGGGQTVHELVPSRVQETMSNNDMLLCEVKYLLYLKMRMGVQFNPGNSNCQGKLKLLRVIGFSSCGGFQQNDQRQLIKVVFMLIHVLL